MGPRDVRRVDRRVVNRRSIEALARAGAFDALDADRARVLANVGLLMMLLMTLAMIAWL